MNFQWGRVEGRLLRLDKIETYFRHIEVQLLSKICPNLECTMIYSHIRPIEMDINWTIIGFKLVYKMSNFCPVSG